MNDEEYQGVRDILAQLVACGWREKSVTNSLQRCDDLIRVYDLACNKRERGCIFAVYGSPKVGKSTLFNSILGTDVLPRRADPTTGSIIDLKREVAKSEYSVTCVRHGDSCWQSFKTPEMVCSFLDKHATQDNPCDYVSVVGPFPDAAAFISNKCVLRDTPGAEALLDTTNRVVDDRLREDSNKALQSIDDELCIPLFCVSAKSIGQEQDKEFYNKNFQKRCCLHVVTHIEHVTPETGGEEEQAVKEDFMLKFKITPTEATPSPIVCTGIKDAPGGETRVNIGLDNLVREMQDFISVEELGKSLVKVANHILCDGIDWDVGYDKELIFKQLEENL